MVHFGLLTPPFLKSHNSLPWSVVNEAILLEKLDKVAEAIEVYKNYLYLFPHDAFAHFRCGTLLGKKKQFNEAKEHLELALNLTSNCPEIYHNLGWVLLSINAKNDIIDYSQEIIQYYRRSVELYRQSSFSNLAKQIQQAFTKAGIEL